MKILLLQLPVPNNALSNLPLALGYLKASVDAAHLPGLQVEILERVSQDRGGDAWLLDAILARDPDIVGFSLYTWNSTRALGLARALKAVAPEILILGGGPEVNQDNQFIMGEAALDWLIFGEGERTFVELCRYLGQGQPDLAHIAGLGHRPRKTEPSTEYTPTAWIINAPRTAIEDVNLVPSAYLSGALENYVSSFMSIELSRWCPSRCTFCYYGRQDLPRGGKRYFDISRVRAELEFGLAHGVEQFHFVEANFNTLPHLDHLFETIHQTGANRRAHFYAEMRGEAIDEAEAARLQAAGFDTVEVGLQSAVPEVLARVKRKNNLPRLIRGVHLLREHGIEVFLDAILGLPGETPQTFQHTLEFIEQNGLAPYDLFHLQILAGTQLKAEAMAGQHGLVWQDAPPYFVLQTAQLSFENLSALHREALERKGDDPTQIAGLPLPTPFALTNPSANDTDTAIAEAFPIARVVLDLDNTPDLLNRATILAHKLASEVIVMLRMGEVTHQKLQMAQAVLAQLSKPNPSGVWHIFVDSQRVLNMPECVSLIKAVQHQAGYLDRLAVFGLQERDPTYFQQWPTLKLYNIVPAACLPSQPSESPASLIARLFLDNAYPIAEWRSLIEQARQQNHAALLLEFETDCELAKIQAALAGIAISASELWFEDWRVTAGLAAAAELPLSLEYPHTYDARSLQIYNIPPQNLAKAALAWTLSQRRSRSLSIT